ncbi:MAG: carboxypeptidase-like regulatory domain-containing protein, partial [Acidobacteria bacterium]|nr:carboxypeptidase-like regulatory domain-containing protein [Acidobacteriota bacterium]
MRMIQRLVLFALTATWSLPAQTYQGSITGTVNDASGGAIVNAKVTVTNQLTNVARSVETDSQGRYTVVYLGPASYRVAANAAGFKEFTARDIPLEIDQVARVDIVMQLGDVTQRVEVTAAAPLVNSETSSKGQVIGHSEVEELPLVNRDWLDLAMLAAGVAENDGDFAGHMTINGARGYDVNYSLEGGMNRTMRLGGSNVQPSVDAIQEFKVQASNYTAENGRMSSGIISAAIKSGTNKLHGSVYEYLRNDYLDACNFFDQDKSKNIRNNFGASLGGPIIHDRLFYFVSYEGVRGREGEPSLGRVPTANERMGDFSESAAVVRDPFNANAPFPGKRMPASRIDPVASKILGHVVMPNLPGGVGQNNVYSNEVTQRRSDQYLVKGDYSFGNG